MLKKILILIICIALLCPAVAFAEGKRIDTLKLRMSTSSANNRQGKDDTYFEEFSDTSLVGLPEGITATGDSVALKDYEISKGFNKRCLELVDNTHGKEYSGPSVKVRFPKVSKGQWEVSWRYKYIPTGESLWSSGTFSVIDSLSKEINYNVIRSADGRTHFNYKAADTAQLEPECIWGDTWYTMTVIVDFDSNEVSCVLKNEGSGKTYTQIGTWFDGQSHMDMAGINMSFQVYGGIWVIDYVRVGKSQGLESYKDGIVKGTTQIKTPTPVSHFVNNRINIMLDGTYEYTTKNPLLSSDGNVMVTAKNIAEILDISYERNISEYILTDGKNKMVFTPDSINYSLNGSQKQLSTKTIQQGKQLFVSLEDVAKTFGYGYFFESTTVKLESLKGGDK